MTEEAKEIALISAVIAADLFENVQKKEEGYIAALDRIVRIAEEFYQKYEVELKTDWEELYDDPQKHGFSKNVCCWDDAIREFTIKKLER